MGKSLSVFCISLGCPKNRVDTERVLGSLGIPIKLCEKPGQSRLIFINTCAFIEPATRESIRAVLDSVEAIRHKRVNKPLIAVAGCMPGRYGIVELARELPEIDLWLAPQEIASWPDKIRDLLRLAASPATGRLTQPGSTWAYLKIGEGCRHKCAFCAIPAIRGPLKSEPLEGIVLEAKKLLAAGAKELVLVAQDVSAWGSDFRIKRDLRHLLEKLAPLRGLKWLRLLYLYPDYVSDTLLKAMAQIGAPVLPYLDIPFQHSDPEILKSMGRPFQTPPLEQIARIRATLPDAALRTTLITGFPGETEAQFLAELEFVKKARFHNLGVFTYQAEDGTPAASFPGQIPGKIKEARRGQLMAAQALISSEILASYVDTEMDVLVDKGLDHEWPGLCQGRVWFQAPEIDGITYVSGANVAPGNFVRCEIGESHTYDLTALEKI